MTFSTFVFTWILCGVIAGAIGSARNVGFGFHAFIGFLFGPIGILTAVLFNPTDEEKYRSQGRLSGLVKCPYCAEFVKIEAKLCRHCRSDLASQQLIDARTVTATPFETEIYRLYQIEIHPDHCRVEGEKFETLEKAKSWIDSQN